MVKNEIIIIIIATIKTSPLRRTPESELAALTHPFGRVSDGGKISSARKTTMRAETVPRALVKFPRKRGPYLRRAKTFFDFSGIARRDVLGTNARVREINGNNLSDYVTLSADGLKFAKGFVRTFFFLILEAFHRLTHSGMERKSRRTKWFFLKKF